MHIHKNSDKPNMPKKIEPNNVTLEPLENHKHTAALETSWTWKIGGYETLKEYVDSKLENPDVHFYWIIVDGTPAGMTGILPHPDHQHLQTSTLIASGYRGSNLNTILKHSISSAFKQMNITLISSVDENNKASIKSLNKITETEPEASWEEKRNRNAHIYTITDITPTIVSSKIVKTLLTLETRLKQTTPLAVITQATLSDTASIQNLIQLSGLQNIHNPPETQKQAWIEWASNIDTITERLKNENIVTLTAKTNNIIVGSGYIKLEQDQAYIGAIYIQPDYQKQNIGTQILTQLLTHLHPNHKNVTAQISEENIPSKKLFTKLGFTYSQPSPSEFFTPTIWEEWIFINA